ncbi:MAG: hypothetical protein IKG58_02680 [Bacilli bacterium]|nr:hypothetical protein [Bacilli bacterium]
MKSMMKRFVNNFENITKYYNFLINKTKKHEYVGIANEWLIDNYYLLVEHKNELVNMKNKFKRSNKKINEHYYHLRSIVHKKYYNVDFKYLVEELRKYQKDTNEVYTYKELKLIIPLLIIIYTEKLNKLCNEEYKKFADNEKIESIISKNDKLSLRSFIDSDFDINKNVNYIYELNNKLYKVENNNQIFKELNEYLKNNNVSIKGIINDELQRKIDNNLIISNIFGNFKEFFEVSEEDLFSKVSETEKLFLKDPVYKKMTDDSKKMYRTRLLKLAKKKKMEEYNYLKSIYNSEKHIGYKLFPHKSNTFRVIIYILSIILSTVGVSFFLSGFFGKWQVLGFIILLIPISQLIVQIFNEILLHNVSIKEIPKLDFSKGIPDNEKTMVVIPTIVSDVEKVEEIFDVLESFYLVNKSNNLYFTLLGDVKASNKKNLKVDKEISEYGKKYAEKLNKKYKKDIFYFIYRKRIWNAKENSYLGYERKRGALLQFNQILLKKSIDEDKYFNVNTLHDHELDIKYVITLDSDTKLLLNSAINLVGAMAHPMNKPVFNQEGTKVIRGYGIMQPRVSVDIESTNNSLYSQIFAGIGGFDTYSAIVPNVYQDSFYEGSFVGKGIYDVKAFDQVLGNTLPDNLILSHDLLEGNYLRCGYVSDVELIGDFPAKFLVDVSRHHRWARGDVQIIGWLKSRVLNKNNSYIKNPINLLGKYKILDNIIRMFLNPMLLLILLLAFTCSKTISIMWFLLVVLEIAISIIFFLRSKINKKNKDVKEVYYKKFYIGGKSIISRAYIVFSTIPFYTKLYMDAFFRTLYRLLISHKNLLNWVTAEEVEKTADGSLKSYIKAFMFNFIMAIVFIVIGVYTHNPLAYIIAFIFTSGPFVTYYVSREIDHSILNLKARDIDNLKHLAYRTWKYFDDNLCSENNYLISDNYQENRENKFDTRTSPTAIGFSLTSVVSAYELEFIDKKKALFLLEKILKSIDSLKKWHGHLYNWYDIKTKKVLYPNFVSTVDSGNLIASIIVVREFLDKNDNVKLVELCDRLIKSANFRKLYTKRHVFSIGYDQNEGKLSEYNYNKFASESRLTSYLAISLGEVSNKHWFCLDKSLALYKNHKGLISWSGTSFEYYMPLLFMKNYPNTLLDEAYNFAYICQKEYMKSVNSKLPWGISEAAYNELDNSLNYKYKSFSTPYLKAKPDKENRIVISPYASLIAIDLFPKEVYENVMKFNKLDMYSKYGYYESYDYDNKGVVKAYFAHHQGMSLLGITNYLKQGVIKDYFHSNVNIRTFELLLKEKVQIKTSIDMKMVDYKKYNYNKEIIENDIRVYNYISYLPEMSVLSNKKYSLIMNDRGNSFSRYRALQLNRYRKVTEQDYGMFLFIKDINTKEVWSNTFAPLNVKPDKYEVVFAADKIKYLRRDNEVTTKTEIAVSKNYHAEIRKVTFRNDSDVDKDLELTSYTEPILSENMDDISHRVFNSMFVSTEYDEVTNCLIAKRKERKEENVNSYMFTKLIINDPADKYSYETERSSFIGRNKTINNAKGIDEKLTNYAGDNLDPIMTLRNRIVVPANESVSIYMLTGFGRSKEQIFEIVNNYNSKLALDNEFEISTLMNIMDNKNMNITGSDMKIYNIMLNYLFQTTSMSVTEEHMNLLRTNRLGQSDLWKFGISGDRPIITVEINDIRDMGFIRDILKAFEYYKNKSIFVDVVIINNELGQFSELVEKEIDDEMYRIYTLNSFYNTPGEVLVLDGSNITKEDQNLLDVVSRLKFTINNHISLEEAVFNLQSYNKVNDYPVYKEEVNIKLDNKDKLLFDNGYGGFSKDGKEYIIYNKDTPTPWSNIITNKNFGTIVTNNGCGYTYAYNSGEFKITSWTNDIVSNDKSEGFKFNDSLFDPEKCTHGFGYSILESETKELKHKVTEFVAVEDNVKIYLMKLKNKTFGDYNANVEFWINPVFGNFEEKTSRHILSEFMGQDNYLKLRNVYHNSYNNVNVFMSASEKINSAICDKMLVKSVTVNTSLKPGEEKSLVFVLGCSLSDEENLKLMKKYTDIKTSEKELKNVKEYWDNKLGNIKVSTPDNSFNTVMNGWYLYQTLSSRIMAKAGFYQISGAFGYRDQLQDAMNISMVEPEYTREQILNNASHQFVEGDVLHWWLEKNRFGLRSKYKDDYLWLVYATCNYINTTGDYKILDEKVPYVIGEALSEKENERGIIFSYSEEKVTLLEHCLKSLDISMNSLGVHKIPLMGGGDWNDGMNKVGIEGKGESVWLGFFLYSVIDLFVDIMKKYNKKFSVDKYITFNSKLKDNLNRNTWDGEYYLRAFFDNGNTLGSKNNKECKIDLISQSFSILSNVIPKDRVSKVINSVEEELVDNNNDIVKLLTPAFAKSTNNPGYIMNYPRGIRENGGQYTHAVSWYLMALIKEGYYNRAYEYYQMINPINRTIESKDVDKYKVEPYVIAADIYSSDKYIGRGGWTWYTGSAGWFYKVGIEDILGIKIRDKKLVIDPNIPDDWKEYKATYKYYNSTYNIHIKRSNKNGILFDGKKQNDNYIDLVDDNKTHDIELYL